MAAKRAPNISAHPITDQLQAGGEEAERAKAAVREAIEHCDGVVTYAAAHLGTSRWTLLRWLEVMPDVKERAEELRAESGQSRGRGAAAARERLGLAAKSKP